MPTAIKPAPVAATKYDPELEAQLGKAAQRIRVNDVFSGVLVLVAIMLGYVAAMVALDRWLDVPDWVRQTGLVGLVAVLAVVGYRTIVRPLRQAVNPLYAAKQVEETVPDAKNGIVNYVDLQDEPLPASIRDAVGARAARQMQAADLNEAFNSRGLVRAGVAVAVLVVVLAALFLLFRPSQFFSLLGRTLTPFSAGAIATRTEIVLIEPAAGDLTVTAGQSVNVAVTVNGRVPDPDGPDRLRVRLRHNPADPNAEEVPLEPAGGNRDWRVRIPDHLVQNGFWYSVAGGDAVTPEYRVQVRSRPLFTAFEARYEYPAYLRLKPEVVREPQLEAYRGTTVTLTARANRELKAARLVIAGQPVPIPGEVVGDARDTARFKFTITDNGSYQLFFSASTGEENADLSPYPIKVYSDQPPAVTVTAPAEEETSLPANGQLKVDGVVGDDFGIDTVTLRLRLADGGGRVLKAKPYQDGKSFRRDADGTYPTSLEYKDSVTLTSLTDEAGKPAPVAEGMVLEYWLEATDNCTVPKANVGKSKVKRVRIAAPQTEPVKQQEQQKQATERKQTETKHQQQQNQKFQNEPRDPPPQPRPDATEPQPNDPKQPGEPQPGAAGGKSGEKQEGEPKQGGEPGAKSPEQPSDPAAKQKPGAADVKSPPDAKPMAGDTGTPPDKTDTPTPMPQAGTPEPKTPGTPPPQAPQPQPATGQKNDAVKQEAERIEQQLNKQQEPGEARGAGDPQPQQGQPSAERKGQPEPGTNPPPQPKGGDPTGGSGPAETKPAGKTPEPPPAAASKGTPQPQAGSPDGPKAGDPEQKQQPLGGSAGTDKQSSPQPKQGANPEKPSDAAQARGAGEETKAGSKPAEPESKPGSAKPAGKPERADTRPGTPEPSPAAAPGDKPTPSAERKPGAGTPPPGSSPQAKPAPDQTTKPAGQDQPAAAKSEGTKPSGTPPTPKFDPKDVEDAVKDLSSQDAQKQQAARDKLDKTVGPDARKAAEQVANDLKSDDPARREAAQKKLEDLKADAERLSRENVQQDPGGKPDPNVERLFREAQKLNSDDPTERKGAEQSLDKAIGQQAREELQKKMKDAKPGDPRQDAATRRQIEEMAKKNQGDPRNQPAGSEKGTTKSSDPSAKPDAQPRNTGSATKEPKIDPKEMEQAVKDLASGDPQKQAAAREKLDKMVGENARKEAEQLMKDLKSDDPAKRTAAQKKLDELDKQAKQAGGQPQKREPTAEEKKQLAEATKDLLSDDPKKQQAGREKLDQMVGKDAREQAEKLANELKSDDPVKQAAARKKLEDLQKQVNGGQPKKDLSPEEMKQLADIAKDMGSKDPAKQKEAAEKFANSDLGKDLAEGLKRQAENMKKQANQSDAEGANKAMEAVRNMADLQKQMNDLKSGDPKKAEEAIKNLKDLAERMKNDTPADRPPPGSGLPDAIGRGPGGSPDTPGTPLKANEDFGKLSSELQLEKFKKVRDNPELLKKLGYTPEDYDRFLKGFEEVVKQERARTDQDPKRGPAPLPSAPRVNVGEATRKVEHRKDGSAGNAQGTGPSYAPPGYGDAAKKFKQGPPKSRTDEKK